MCFWRVEFQNKRGIYSDMLKNRKVGIVLILLICVCFANCRYLRGKSDTEVSAIRTIVTIRTLQNQYASKHQGKFAPNFDELIKYGNLAEQFAGEKPIVNGYVFTMTVTEPTGAKPAFYSIKAKPRISEGFNATGTRSFYFDSLLGTIKYSEEGEANPESPSI